MPASALFKLAKHTSAAEIQTYFMTNSPLKRRDQGEREALPWRLEPCVRASRQVHPGHWVLLLPKLFGRTRPRRPEKQRRSRNWGRPRASVAVVTVVKPHQPARGASKGDLSVRNSAFGVRKRRWCPCSGVRLASGRPNARTPSAERRLKPAFSPDSAERSNGTAPRRRRRPRRAVPASDPARTPAGSPPESALCPPGRCPSAAA